MALQQTVSERAFLSFVSVCFHQQSVCVKSPDDILFIFPMAIWSHLEYELGDLFIVCPLPYILKASKVQRVYDFSLLDTVSMPDKLSSSEKHLDD